VQQAGSIPATAFETARFQFQMDWTAWLICSRTRSHNRDRADFQRRVSIETRAIGDQDKTRLTGSSLSAPSILSASRRNGANLGRIGRVGPARERAIAPALQSTVIGRTCRRALSYGKRARRRRLVGRLGMAASDQFRVGRGWFCETVIVSDDITLAILTGTMIQSES
jgi:hypothetical protein